MNPAAAGGVPYWVPPEPSRWRALALATVVHAGLLLFLWAGVRWQNTAPVEVEAEVWDMHTHSAASPPQVAPEPAPTPPEPAKVVQPPVEEPVAPKAPDIALERARIKAAQQKLVQEKKLAEQQAAKDKAKELAERKKKELADKLADKLAKSKQAIAEKKLLDKARELEMKRITGGGTSGDAPKATAPRIDSGYVASITAKIKSNIAYSGATDLPGNPRAVYRIDQLPTGEIVLAKRIKSSGVPAYDSAVENAIWKSSPLPRKKDGTVERSIEAGFEMKDVP
jgi:colicin import membrane protein